MLYIFDAEMVNKDEIMADHLYRINTTNYCDSLYVADDREMCEELEDEIKLAFIQKRGRSAFDTSFLGIESADFMLSQKFTVMYENQNFVVTNDWTFDTKEEAEEFFRSFDLIGEAERNDEMRCAIYLFPVDDEYEGDPLDERYVEFDEATQSYKEI